MSLFHKEQNNNDDDYAKVIKQKSPNDFNLKYDLKQYINTKANLNKKDDGFIGFFKVWFLWFFGLLNYVIPYKNYYDEKISYGQQKIIAYTYLEVFATTRSNKKDAKEQYNYQGQIYLPILLLALSAIFIIIGIIGFSQLIYGVGAGFLVVGLVIVISMIIVSFSLKQFFFFGSKNVYISYDSNMAKQTSLSQNKLFD